MNRIGILVGSFFVKAQKSDSQQNPEKERVIRVVLGQLTD
jgi:hypothetical protein